MMIRDIFPLLKDSVFYRTQRQPWQHKSSGQRTVILGAITTFILIFFISTYVNYQKNLSTLTAVRKQLTALSFNQTLINQYEENVHSNPQKFAAFQKKHIEAATNPDELKNTLAKLQKNLKIQYLNSQFSNRTGADELLKLSKITISIDIKTLQDKQFFQFMDKIQQDIPGIVTVTNFQLKRTSSLTNDILNQVPDGKTILFDGKIIFEWIYFDSMFKES